MATETATKSNNAKLMALKISSGKSLVPAFHQETTSYIYNVNNEISSITITPTRVIWFKSTITVNRVSVNSASESQPIELTVGGNVINIVVTAEDEVTTNTYTIYVIREESVVPIEDTPIIEDVVKNTPIIEDVVENTPIIEDIVEDVSIITVEETVKRLPAVTGPKSLGTLNCMVPVTISLVP
jgi:hypothetical protein